MSGPHALEDFTNETLLLAYESGWNLVRRDGSVHWDIYQRTYGQLTVPARKAFRNGVLAHRSVTRHEETRTS